MATELRIEFDAPAVQSPLFSYYAISNLDVEGSCACFGHASTCTGIDGASCACQHNTAGTHCDRCQPLFNNSPWAIGTNQNASYCQQCNCGGHASSCHFDSNFGSGVCDNCTHFTAGHQCQFCIDFYYVNPSNFSLLSSSALCYGSDGSQNVSYNCSGPCLPCNCNMIGSTILSLYNCANATGQCYCKNNVGGRVCDVCLDGFWNMSLTNVQGCQVCYCNQIGTVNNSNLCQKSTGQCVCKTFVQSGGICDTCQIGYFNLAANNPDGCSFCDCDLGASTSQICPVIYGTCSCKNFISGRTCRNPFPGYFGPSLDFLTYEAEFANNAASFPFIERAGQGDSNGTITGLGFINITLASVVNFTITVPRTFLYNVILRYEDTMLTISGVQVTFQLINPSLEMTNVFQCNGTNHTTNGTQQLVGNISPKSVGGFVSFGNVCLLSSPTAVYQMMVQFPASNFFLNFDSIVIMPVYQLINAYIIANSTMTAKMALCYSLAETVDNALRAADGCPSIDYSLMTDLYNGAVVCNCNITGSLNSSYCAPQGGQCFCKPNVIMRDCSQCHVDSYGFVNGNGCTLCSCNVFGSALTSCNNSGICSCKQNVTGIKCDSCILNYYGLHTGEGCIPCVCNAMYAVNNSCMDNGQCYCDPGVGGLTCNQCANGYFNLQTDGCISCGCDVDGSLATTACNNITGTCNCKQNTIGATCNMCRNGYFGLGPWGYDGCIPCYCFGRSTNCTSASNWHVAMVVSNWGLTSNVTATQPNWLGVDDSGNTFAVLNPTLITNNDAKRVMRILINSQSMMNRILYFSTPTSYLGFKRGAYGQFFNFSLSTQVPANVSMNVTYVNSTSGDVIIRGTNVLFTAVYRLPYLPSTTRTDYFVKIHESNFYVNDTTGLQITYEQLQQILINVQSIEIRGKYYNALGAITDLYYASLNYAVYNPFSLDPLINNIEQCFCPLGYTGEFCDMCPPGYTRQVPNGGPLSECVRCFCNNHDVLNTTCDPENGTCVCTDNTKGRQCELCMDGFYGVAKDGRPADCQPCLCPGNVITGDINVFAQTCAFSNGQPLQHVCNNCSIGHAGPHCEICINDWFGTPQNPLIGGGICSPCSCNGRAQTCNSTTGYCLNCTNSTTGGACDQCAPGFYGNPMIQPCRACNCNITGSTGECDSVTGQCYCQPNVMGYNCDTCQLFTYTNGTGNCLPCNCSVLGSLSQGCNRMTGQCSCNSNVIGQQCNSCSATFWNVAKGCQPCLCSPIGTVYVNGSVFGTCDVTTGQCQCVLPSIAGRKCDTCANATTKNFTFVHGHSIGTYPQCQLCGNCYDMIGSIVDAIGLNITTTYGSISTLWSNNFNNLTNNTVVSLLVSWQQNLTSWSTNATFLQSQLQQLIQLNNTWTNATSTLSSSNSQMDMIGQTEIVIQSKLNTILSYLNNPITFNGSILPNAITLGNEMTALINQQNQTFISTSATWSIISNAFNILANSSGIVTLLQGLVNSAYVGLNASVSMSTAASLLLNQSHSVDPSAQLNYAQLNLSLAEALLQSLIVEVGLTNATMAESTLSISSAINILANNYNVTSSLIITLQSLLTSATQSQGYAQNAKSVTDQIYNQAFNTKQIMIGTILSCVSALQTLNNASAELVNVTSMVAYIKGVQLSPMSYIQSLTSQILSTQAPVGQVASLTVTGLQNIATAQNALAVTQRAQNSSATTLQAINNVLSSLQQTQQMQSTAQTGLISATSINNNINAIYAFVSGKSSNATSLAASTSAAISNISNVMSTLQLNFMNIPNRIQVASNTCTMADIEANYAAANETQNQANAASMQSQIVQVQASLAQDINMMQPTLVQFEANQLQLATLGSLVIALNTEITSQLSDIALLDHQLQTLENQIGLLMITLQQLNPATTRCTN